jgi:hypothetical protein
VLLLSNTVTALTTFYLAGDVNLLLAAPIGRRQLHHARFVETAVSSSWMVLLFGMPAFLALRRGLRRRSRLLCGHRRDPAALPRDPVRDRRSRRDRPGPGVPARRARDALLVLVGVLVASASWSPAYRAPSDLPSLRSRRVRRVPGRVRRRPPRSCRRPGSSRSSCRSCTRATAIRSSSSACSTAPPPRSS